MGDAPSMLSDEVPLKLGLLLVLLDALHSSVCVNRLERVLFWREDILRLLARVTLRSPVETRNTYDLQALQATPCI